MQEKIVIVGFGWVGQANALALTTLGYDVSYFDPGSPHFHYEEGYRDTYAKIPKLGSVLEKDSENMWYMVCVGDRVSPEGVQDISSIQKALESLKSTKGHVILRSTVLPDLLSTLSFDVYMPEFLHEKKAVEECITPHYFVVGRSKEKENIPEPSFFNIWEKRAYRVFRGTPEEASSIKYLSNLWNALRIAFVNEFGNALNYPDNAESLGKIERVTDFIFERKIYLRYGKAFGGHCLPKDSRAFSRWYREKGRNVSLLEGMVDSNNEQEKIQEKYPVVREWFSEWNPPAISGKIAFGALFASIKRRLHIG